MVIKPLGNTNLYRMVLGGWPLMKSKQVNQQYMLAIGKSMDGIVNMPKAAIEENSMAPDMDGFFAVCVPIKARPNVRKTSKEYPFALVAYNIKYGKTATAIEAKTPDCFNVRHWQKISGIKPTPATKAVSLIDAGCPPQMIVDTFARMVYRTWLFGNG